MAAPRQKIRVEFFDDGKKFRRKILQTFF